MERPSHALTVDVEDWYHDAGLRPDPASERVERNVEQVLEILAGRGARATFFFLGEVAERYPRLVRRVAESGHEVGSHGFRHRRVNDQARREFREDVARSLRVIEDAAGTPVRGYRAPYFSIKADVRWPVEILRDLGLDYDSSVLAIDRPPGLEVVCPRGPHRHENGLLEIPVAILNLFFFWNLPLASGTGLRFFSADFLEKRLARFERDVGPGVFYFHPWDLDPDSPVVSGLPALFLGTGRKRFGRRLGELLSRVRFDTIEATFADRLREPVPPAARAPEDRYRGWAFE